MVITAVVASALACWFERQVGRVRPDEGFVVFDTKVSNGDRSLITIYFHSKGWTE